VHEVDPSELSFFASNFFAQTISDASCLSFWLFYLKFFRQCISLSESASCQLPDLLLLSELKVHSRQVVCFPTHFNLVNFPLSLEPPVSVFHMFPTPFVWLPSCMQGALFLVVLASSCRNKKWLFRLPLTYVWFLRLLQACRCWPKP
jgi:hypothetical protein